MREDLETREKDESRKNTMENPGKPGKPRKDREEKRDRMDQDNTYRNPAEEEKREINTKLTKCPRCGANMEFDPKTQGLRCPYCQTLQSLPQDLKTAEIGLEEAFRSGEKWEEDATVFECKNCSAKVVLEKGETAKRCPFCGAGNIVPSEEMAGVKPNGVLPFRLTAEEGAVAAGKWAKKRLFAPRRFRKKLSPENVAGVYSPCFTFDSCTSSTYQGQLGKHYTVTVTDSKGRTHTETRTRYFSVSGSLEKGFDDILVNAGSKIDDKMMSKLRPFDTNNGLAYRPEFLSGFMANHYDRPVTEMWNEAKSRMDSEIKRAIVAQYDADVVSYLNVSTRHERVTYKYVLLPVYVGNFNYKKKAYNFFVNGISGKTAGKAPVSPVKVAITALFGIAAMLLLAWLIMRA